MGNESDSDLQGKEDATGTGTATAVAPEDPRVDVGMLGGVELPPLMGRVETEGQSLPPAPGPSPEELRQEQREKSLEWHRAQWATRGQHGPDVPPVKVGELTQFPTKELQALVEEFRRVYGVPGHEEYATILSEVIYPQLHGASEDPRGEAWFMMEAKDGAEAAKWLHDFVETGFPPGNYGNLLRLGRDGIKAMLAEDHDKKVHAKYDREMQLWNTLQTSSLVVPGVPDFPMHDPNAIGKPKMDDLFSEQDEAIQERRVDEVLEEARKKDLFTSLRTMERGMSRMELLIASEMARSGRYPTAAELGTIGSFDYKKLYTYAVLSRDADDLGVLERAWNTMTGNMFGRPAQFLNFALNGTSGGVAYALGDDAAGDAIFDDGFAEWERSYWNLKLGTKTREDLVGSGWTSWLGRAAGDELGDTAESAILGAAVADILKGKGAGSLSTSIGLAVIIFSGMMADSTGRLVFEEGRPVDEAAVIGTLEAAAAMAIEFVPFLDRRHAAMVREALESPTLRNRLKAMLGGMFNDALKGGTQQAATNAGRELGFLITGQKPNPYDGGWDERLFKDVLSAAGHDGMISVLPGFPEWKLGSPARMEGDLRRVGESFEGSTNELKEKLRPKREDPVPRGDAAEAAPAATKSEAEPDHSGREVEGIEPAKQPPGGADPKESVLGGGPLGDGQQGALEGGAETGPTLTFSEDFTYHRPEITVLRRLSEQELRAEELRQPMRIEEQLTGTLAQRGAKAKHQTRTDLAGKRIASSWDGMEFNLDPKYIDKLIDTPHRGSDTRADTLEILTHVGEILRDGEPSLERRALPNGRWVEGRSKTVEKDDRTYRVTIMVKVEPQPDGRLLATPERHKIERLGTMQPR